MGSAETKFAPEPKADISQLWAKLKAAGAPQGAAQDSENASAEQGSSDGTDANKVFQDNINKTFANLDAWVPDAFPDARYTDADTAIAIVFANTDITDATEAALGWARCTPAVAAFPEWAA